MESNSGNINHHIILEYFRLIDRKDTHGLLNLFTDDCIIYEPFSKEPSSYNGIRNEKRGLRGKSEIASFFRVIMMVSDGLQHEIEFIDNDVDATDVQIEDIATSESSSIVSALASFYKNKNGDNLKERLTFHIVSKLNDDTNERARPNSNKKIKTLWIRL